ncbi:hypothetical protein CSUI_010466, partial [Cystoisospora suis]
MLLLKSVEDVGVAAGSRGSRRCLSERPPGCPHLDQTDLPEGKGPLSLLAGATGPNGREDVVDRPAGCPADLGASFSSGINEISRRDISCAKGVCLVYADPLFDPKEEAGAITVKRPAAWRILGSKTRASVTSAAGGGAVSEMARNAVPAPGSEKSNRTSAERGAQSDELFCSTSSCVVPSDYSSCSRAALCSTPLSSSSSSTDLTSAPSPSSASCPSPSSSPPGHVSPFSSPPAASPCSRQLSSSRLCPSQLPSSSGGQRSCLSFSSPAGCLSSPDVECADGASSPSASSAYLGPSLRESGKFLSGDCRADHAATGKSLPLSGDAPLAFESTEIYPNTSHMERAGETSPASASLPPSSVSIL